MPGKRCQVCDGPIANGRCKLCGMPYRNDEILYHLNENRSEHYRHATPKAREIMKEQQIPPGDRKVSGKRHSTKEEIKAHQQQVRKDAVERMTYSSSGQKTKKSSKKATSLSLILTAAIALFGILPSVINVIKEAVEDSWFYSSPGDEDVYFSMPNEDVYFSVEEDGQGGILYTMDYGYDSVEVGMDMEPGTYRAYVKSGSATIQVQHADGTKNYSVSSDVNDKVLVLREGDMVSVYEADARNRKVYFNLLNKTSE